MQSFIEQQSQDGKWPVMRSRIISNMSKIMVVGDLHGNSKAVRHFLYKLYLEKKIDKAGKLAPNVCMVYTGDLTDRGDYGPEVWALVLQLISRNPDQVFITRGNHENVQQACSNNFFEQMQRLTNFSYSGLVLFLDKLFACIPFGLFLGIAPEPRQDEYNAPYHFLFCCHAGIDPVIKLNYFFQKIVQDHKKTGSMAIGSHYFSHKNPEESGLLWTDFRANRFSAEPSCRNSSTRGAHIHLFNASAVADFFSEHVSCHPRQKNHRRRI
jgi:hypothetical protein